MDPTTIKKQKHSKMFSPKTLLEGEFLSQICVFKKNL